MMDQFPAGVVEGFYGPPWSHSARVNMIKFLGKNGFNIYIYAPKDDPYHREKWAEPYPRDLLGRLAELVDVSNRSGVSFCFAISPGLSMTYSSENDLDKLTSKFREVAKLGIRWFGLFLDDIPQEFQHEQDKRAYKSLGEAHAHLCNRLEKGLREIAGDGVRLIMCPTQYVGVEPAEYHRAIADGLSPAVYVMWTGKYVLSPTITGEDADSFGRGIGRKPFLWDNYPVNDYVSQNKVFLGPVKGRTPDLMEHLSGFVSNPMNQEEASKLVLITYREYFRDHLRYDPDAAWGRAVKELLPRPICKDFMAFSEHSRACFLDYSESQRLEQLVKRVLEKPKELGPLNVLARYLTRQRRSVNALRQGLKGPLKGELKPALRKVVLLLEIGIVSTDLLKRTRRGSTKASRKKAKIIDSMVHVAQQDESQVLGELRILSSMDGRKPVERDSFILDLARLATSSKEE